MQENSDLEYVLVDLAEVNLPLLDEPLKAALGDYRHEHTLAWSALVSSFDAFLFVFPQYNWGYPAVLKNALDYLRSEWRDKPATVFTYGTRGGGSGAAQLITVLHGLNMQVMDAHVEAVITDSDVDDRWQLVDTDATLQPTLPLLQEIDHQFVSALGVGPDVPS